MSRVKLLYLIIVLVPLSNLYSQSIDNLKLLFHEEHTAIYECDASPVGNAVSFRTSAGNVDMHYLYDFKNQSPVPIFSMDGGFVGNTVKRNTKNLIWSRYKKNGCLLEVVEDGKTSFAEIIYNQNNQVKVRYFDVSNLNPSQFSTATLLVWFRKEAVLSRWFSKTPIEGDIPAKLYDLHSMLPDRSNAKTTIIDSNPSVRELHASPFGRDELIVSGVDDTGMNELFYMSLRGKEKFAQRTRTPKLSESWPAVSPRNDFVVFANPHGKNENRADLFIMPISGGEPEILVTDIYIPATSYSSSGIYQWSKDGKEVVYISYSPENKNPLSVVDVKSKTVNPFDIDVVFPTSFAISGDEKNILIVAAGTSVSNDQTSYKAFVGDYHY
jgi:hypothetical protein